VAVADLLCPDVVDEFRSRFDADLGLHLSDKRVSVHLACIELLESVI
jgi:hypothetical protein